MIQTSDAPKIDDECTIPTPTSRQPRESRFARCGGELSHAFTAPVGVPRLPEPQKMFSPTRTRPRKYPVCWNVRVNEFPHGVCEKLRHARIFSAFSSAERSSDAARC